MSGKAFEKLRTKMAELAKKTKTPMFGQFELTPCCNLDCKMCYVHNQNSNKMRDKELSTETWKQIFDDAYDMGLLFANLTGGECLLRKDFKELYLHLWNKQVAITVLTNGLLINEDYISFFKTYPPRKVQISLYGSNEEGYLNVTGHTGYEKAVTAIRSLIDAGIYVMVALTPSSFNKDDYINLLRFCKDNKFACNPGVVIPIANRDDPNKTDHYLSMDEMVNLSQKRALLSGPLTPVDKTPEIGGSCTEAPVGLSCNAGCCSYSVSWDGKMHPCTALATDGVSLLEMPYAEAWERTKKAVSEMLLGMECVDCPYDKTCPKCPAIRLLDFHSGHCNPAVCELTRKLVAAGVKKLDAPEQSHE